MHALSIWEKHFFKIPSSLVLTGSSLAFAKGYLGWEQEFFVIKAEHYKVRKKTLHFCDLQLVWLADVVGRAWIALIGMTHDQARPDLVNTGRTLFGKLPTRHQQGEHAQADGHWILHVSRCFKCLAAIHRWFLWNIKLFFQTEVENCRNMPEQEVKHAEFGWICTNLLILNFSTNMNQEM